MSTEIETIINELLNAEQNVFGVAIINKSGSLITQTQNWDLSSDLDKVNELLKAKLELGQRGMSNI